MPRAFTTHSHEPYVAKTKANAHAELLALREANKVVVLSGSGTYLQYRVVKVKGGYGIAYKRTGKWRTELSNRQLGIKKMPKTLNFRRRR